MKRKIITKNNLIEPTSYLWHTILINNRIPQDGIVMEVAPGYEPKIGNALALLGFRGTIFLVEPDRKAALHIQKTYQQILSHATVKIVTKPLQDIVVGVDVSGRIDALVASHPFDDMVISFVLDETSFFSQEKEDGTELSSSAQKFYDALRDDDYAHGIQKTVATWKYCIENLKPNYFIASQYPSHMLTVKGLVRRQNSGFAVLKQLQRVYKNSLVKQYNTESFGYKGNPCWWIIAKNPRQDQCQDILRQPCAMARLGTDIFVPQHARRLRPDEYDMVYVDNKYFDLCKGADVLSEAQEFAITLHNKPLSDPDTVIAYADRQKDETNIGLGGNIGSGRAVYYGDRYNILGVGKTTLCKSTIPSHSTGKLEMIGAMRRIILSKWINFFTHRAPVHTVLIALKETTLCKWNKNPIPLSLLVRIDDGSLDRPSHIEQSPKIPINFQKVIIEYAKLDAEYFSYRIMLGAWSTSNYSLSGHMIDLESGSFVKNRGPYYTSSAKYPDNRFGYEGIGFLKILHQLASAKNIKASNIENLFYQKRRQHLGRCLLSLLGIENNMAVAFFARHQRRVVKLADQFEWLAKKISSTKSNLNLYTYLSDDEDPSLLDMSQLFRNLAQIVDSPDTETKAFDLVIRKNAISQVHIAIGGELSNPAEAYIQKQKIIDGTLESFLHETKHFIHDLFHLLALLESEKCLNRKDQWHNRLQAINQTLPTMFALNERLKYLAESYRLGEISTQALGEEISTLCELPVLGKK